jgi:hypothetical protein
LITRWKCHSATCNHQGTCWIDENGEHHKINAVMRERWAAAIQDGQATQYQPPLRVYKALVSKADDQPLQKRPKVSAFEDMRQMLKEQMEFTMIKSMRAMATESQPLQQPQQYYAPPPPPPPPQPPFTYPYTTSHYAPGGPPSPSPTPHTRPIPEATRPQQRSSPIGGRTEEDDIIESFWQWKKEGTNKQARKLQFCQAQRTLEEQMWGLDDMKAMADISSDIYKSAIGSGLPEGLIRGLKADLKEFKPLWKEVYQPAMNLSNLGHQAGGFE